MNTAVAVLEAAWRYWLPGVVVFLAVAILLAGVADIIRNRRGRK